MSSTFLEDIQSFSEFWKRHHYCLFSDSIPKGIRMLATGSEAFCHDYSPFFLTKILQAFCSFEKQIQENPHNRTVLVRLLKTHHTENSNLGIAAAVNLRSHTEVLSHEHLLKAILHIVPGVIAVPEKNYLYRDENSGILFLYQEIEKKRGRGFSASDISQLKKSLCKELAESIESFSPPLCLVRNEEELLRNILQLSRELQTEKDLPQVIISFQEQTPSNILRFSIIVLRLVDESNATLEDLSGQLPQTIKCTIEMVSNLGRLSQTHTKQANTLLFEIQSSFFLRKNGSIDLREARSYVAKALELMIGEYRDFNGGLFSKQSKQLREIKEMLEDSNQALVESLFYAFTPSLFQTFILPEAGKACAALFFEAKKAPLFQKTHLIFKHIEKNFSLAVIKTSSEQLRNALITQINQFAFPFHQFGYAVQTIDKDYYLQLIYQYPTDHIWLETLEKLLISFRNIPKPKRKRLRINFQDGDPLSFHPHIGLDLRCRSVQKALFEGLTRISPSGIAELAAAKALEISEDGLTYIFSLRDQQWSNGEEVTAFQFEKTWKKAITSSSCLRPDVFYVLKNAKKARFSKASSDDIGVQALDRWTLKVSLEHPTPFFLQLLSHPLFFPLYEENGEPYVFNGPFALHTWNRDQNLILIKNPYYWDFENVKLEGVEISIIRDSALAFEKYQKGDIDWIGGPFSLLPPGLIAKLENLQRVDTPGVAWLYCNLTHPPLSSAKVRRAFACALDRNRICEKSFLNPIPLKTHLPTGLSLLQPEEIYSSPDPDFARELFKEGLFEAGLTSDRLSELTLVHSHIAGQKELALEVQEQWQDTFGIPIHRVEETWNTFSHQLDNRMIHFGPCYRHPFYYDPMYFFNIFYESTNIHNAFGWQDETFNQYIQQARQFPNDRSYLKLAEQELLMQMPVIPIYMVTYHYHAREDLKGIHFSHSGDVDFRWIYFESR